MIVELINAPTEKEWMEVKERALVTIGKKAITHPDSQWKHDMLRARHSPIRHLSYSFLLEGIPSWCSTHLCRHVMAQPYVKSQRNDRQDNYDRNKAPQDSPVDMIWEMNAEELMTVANKRLCMKASPETRHIVELICEVAEKHTPEFHGLLIPMCERLHGHCEEIYPCGRFSNIDYVDEVIPDDSKRAY